MQLCDAGRNSCVLLFAGELICACMFQSRKPRGALRTRALFYLAKQRTFCRLEKLLDGYRYVPPGLSRLVACRCLWMQVGCLGLTGCLWLPVDACGCLGLTGCLWLPVDVCGCLGLTGCLCLPVDVCGCLGLTGCLWLPNWLPAVACQASRRCLPSRALAPNRLLPRSVDGWRGKQKEDSRFSTV